MTTYQTFYISTGAKNAMHTLRMSRMNTDIQFVRDSYIKNLAVDVETAQEKATAFFKDWIERVGGSTDDFVLELDVVPEYDIKLRRGKLSAKETQWIEDIEDGIFPFGKHNGTKIVDAPDSYILFFADKAKDEEQNPVMHALTAICMGIASERGLFAKREIAKQERAEKDALSNFVGNVGDRQMFKGEIVSKFYNEDQGFYVTKIRQGDDLICYVGQSIGERNTVVEFKATIKKHSEYKGIKSTQVNRPKLV